VNRIEPVISGGPYTSSATYECDVNNLAGPDNLAVLDDGRVLIGEDTGKHENNMVWLWGSVVEPDVLAGDGANASDDIEIEVDMGDREIYLSAEETRSVSADEGWPTVRVTFYNLSSDSEYNRISRMMDYSVSPPVEMFCNNWPSVLTSGPCSFNSTFIVTPGLDRQAFISSYPALEDSTNACMEVTLENLDTGEVRTKMSCWTQKSLSDWDYDGVIDILDICGDTPVGTVVNANGCVEASETDSVPGFGAILGITAVLGAALITSRRD
jgi:PGF-CTERM protein